MSMFYSMPSWHIVKKSNCLLFFTLAFFAFSTPEYVSIDTPAKETKYSLSVNASEGGVVNSSSGTYIHSTSVTIKATPNSAYIFFSWSNESTENPLTLTINADTELLANFKRLPQRYVDDGIYLDVDYDINFRKLGNGPVKVVLGVIFGH